MGSESENGEKCSESSLKGALVKFEKRKIDLMFHLRRKLISFSFKTNKEKLLAFLITT